MEQLIAGAAGEMVARATKPVENEELISAFEALAIEEGWLPGDSLRKYSARSVNFAGIVEGRVAGGIQLVLNDPTQDLPCHDVWPEYRNNMNEKTAHVAILVIERQHRTKTSLFWLLAVSLWQYCRSHAIDDLTLEATPKSFRNYCRLGWPLSIVGPIRMHWGEPCYLTRLSVAEAEQSIRSHAPTLSHCRLLSNLADQIDASARY